MNEWWRCPWLSTPPPNQPGLSQVIRWDHLGEEDEWWMKMSMAVNAATEPAGAFTSNSVDPHLEDGWMNEWIMKMSLAVNTATEPAGAFTSNSVRSTSGKGRWMNKWIMKMSLACPSVRDNFFAMSNYWPPWLNSQMINCKPATLHSLWSIRFLRQVECSKSQVVSWGQQWRWSVQQLAFGIGQHP